MRLTIITVLLILSFVTLNKLYQSNELDKMKVEYSIDNLMESIDNSTLKNTFDRNTYNSNYIGIGNNKAYCNLQSDIQSRLIKTYFYNYKDSINFLTFLQKNDLLKNYKYEIKG